MRQIVLLDPGQRQHVGGLLVGGPEPHEIGVFDDGVEHHQTLDGVVQGHGFPQAAVRFADGPVERALVQVVDARAVVATVVHRGVAEPHQLVEELPCLLAMHDAAEARVLTRHAHACRLLGGREVLPCSIASGL
jgi:hypothetical protein